MSEIESTAPVEVTQAPVAAPIATPEPPSTADEVDTPEGESPDATPEKTLTQSEVNKIVQKEKAQASRRAEKLVEARLRAEYAERRLAEIQAPPAPPPSGEPVREQFEDDVSFVKALIQHGQKQEREAYLKANESQQRSREFEQVAVKVGPKIDSGREKYDDFDEVVRDVAAALPQPTHDAIIESFVFPMLDKSKQSLPLKPNLLPLQVRLEPPPQLFPIAASPVSAKAHRT